MTDASEEPQELGPELFIAVVYPVGTDADRLLQTLDTCLAEVRYTTRLVHIIERLAGDGDDSHRNAERYNDRMDLGNEFRARIAKDHDGRLDGLSLFAAAEIQRDREAEFAHLPVDKRTIARTAWIIRSLKRPEEVHSLRQIYGDSLWVLAANSSRESRLARLTEEDARSDPSAQSLDDHQIEAEKLIKRDELEGSDPNGQRLSATFALADVVVDASHPDRLEETLRRFVRSLFDYQFETPTRDEYGMFQAFGASLRSSDLSRQVGAAIAREGGEVVALGTNEVPRGGGGIYWPDDENDQRDFETGRDVQWDLKERGFRQILDALSRLKLLAEDVELSFNKAWLSVQSLGLLNVSEYGRAIHAEMGALIDAARRGTSVQDCTLFTTTFPCHVCARHIVAAGVRRVVFNEPYPKSLTDELHTDAITYEPNPPWPGPVAFSRFVGIAPRVYSQLFAMTDENARKDGAGHIATWDPRVSKPRFSGTTRSYLPNELKAAEILSGAPS